MKKLALIVNPIAGMGGRVGLKGTDGENILEKAISLGASKEAPRKAQEALIELSSIKDQIKIITCGGQMGGDISKSLGFKTEIVYEAKETTSSLDTKKALEKILKEDVDLILFAGGDGTARDIYEIVGLKKTVLGIPSGVKIHSPVYASTPREAGIVALKYLTGKITRLSEEEVVDIDEEAFRKDKVQTSLYGYLKVPLDRGHMQNKKAPTPLGDEASQKAIALDIVDNMEEDTNYIIGPGTTTREIMQTLGLPYTLLGVDIVRNKKIIKLDCSENDILKNTEKGNSKLILTPTGGQGYLLGRGNQQISGQVITRVCKENIIIISVESKLVDLRGQPLKVYTGDKEIDSYLKGYYRVKVGYEMDKMYLVSN